MSYPFSTHPEQCTTCRTYPPKRYPTCPHPPEKCPTHLHSPKKISQSPPLTQKLTHTIPPTQNNVPSTPTYPKSFLIYPYPSKKRSNNLHLLTHLKLLIYQVTWSFGHMVINDHNWEIYLPFHKAYDSETWMVIMDEDFPSAKPHNWLRGHLRSSEKPLDLRFHKKPVGTKLSRMVT